MDPNEKIWNLNMLESPLTDFLEKIQIPGVTDSYSYIGMWPATFCWHAEDMDLYAVNFIHYGAPKT